MYIRWLILIITSCGTFTACSSQATYRKAPVSGRFSGEPRMVAIAPNTFFFCQPEDSPPFSFTTHRHGDTPATGSAGRGTYRREAWTIIPEPMITNGASVPRNLWYMPGFSPFDFTRAALIHDWIFEAHHRYIMAEAAYKKSHHARSKADMVHYAPYKDIAQADAADIFAECIKVSMESCKVLLGRFDAFEKRGKKRTANARTLDELTSALRYNRPHPFTLWAYHYFVSPDCIAKESVTTWNHPGSDLDIYRVLTRPEISDFVEKQGYLSPWLIAQFKRVLVEDQRRHEAYEKAVPDPVQRHALEAAHSEAASTQKPAQARPSKLPP